MKMQTRIGYSSNIFCKYFRLLTMTHANLPFLFNTQEVLLADAIKSIPVEQTFHLVNQAETLSFEPCENINFEVKLVMFGDITWSNLSELLTMLGEHVVNTQVKRPTEQLATAIVFGLSGVMSGSEQSTMMAWAEKVGVELCYVNSKIKLNEPGLIVMDMDSTAIQIECIDEIAKLAGVGEQVAAVTEQAMRGELDFAESLKARVATLKDAPISIIDEVANNLPLMPGLVNLVETLKQNNWKVVIASGGFTYMTDKLKEQLGLDKTVANQLGMAEGKLTGEVHGTIVDAQAKADIILALAEQWDIPMSQTVAMGDGANDLVMMATAELGVAFHAKPLVREQADTCVRNGGLDQLLYML